MATPNSTIQIFCVVDEELKDILKHNQARLYSSEVVAIGILFALK